MSGLLSIGSRAAVLVADAAAAYDSIMKASSPHPCEEEKTVQVVDAANRVVLLSFSIAENLLTSEEKKRGDLLYKLKSIEAMPRVLNVITQSLLQGIHAEASLRGFVRYFEKGIVAPLADVCRVGAEIQGYNEKRYLEMDSKELENAQRPIYEIEDCAGVRIAKVVGHRPVDREECEKNLASFQSMGRKSLATRLVAQAGGVEILVSDVGLPLYERLALFMAARRQQEVQRGEQEQRPLLQGERRIAPIVVGEDEVEIPRIPPPLYQDQVFRRFVCSISQRPIRDPVRDPADRKILYERSEIVTALQYDPRSPITRRPLTVDQLQEVPGLRRAIDHRLQQHTEGMFRYLQRVKNVPLNDPELQAIVDRYDDPGE